jgi:hypothetical protein
LPTATFPAGISFTETLPAPILRLLTDDDEVAVEEYTAEVSEAILPNASVHAIVAGEG